MIQKNKHGIYTSSLLASLGIFHGFSDRHAGDILHTSGLNNVLSLIGIRQEETIKCEQIHGGAVRLVTSRDIGAEIKQCDGLVYKDDLVHPIGLRLRVADCVPIICVDPISRVLGVAHAGWKGTVAGIAQTLVGTMISAGAHALDLYVAIGLLIGMCCY